jgi:hypothetical protein
VYSYREPTVTVGETRWNGISYNNVKAHDLIDALPEEKLGAVRNLLELLVEPLSRSLATAAVEEEELTPETAAGLDRSRAHSLVAREFPTRMFSVSSVRERGCQPRFPIHLMVAGSPR